MLRISSRPCPLLRQCTVSGSSVARPLPSIPVPLLRRVRRSGYQPPGAACRPGGTGGEPTGISDTPSILGSPVAALRVRKLCLGRDTDLQSPATTSAVSVRHSPSATSPSS